MDADVADPARRHRRRRERVPEDGLVQVHEADPLRGERGVELGDVPGGVPDLEDEREPLQRPGHLAQPGPAPVVPLEGPGELQEGGAQAPRVGQEVEPLPGGAHLVLRERGPLVGEAAPHLGGEPETGTFLDPGQPGSDRPGGRGTIEGGVDLDEVEVAREPGQGVESPGSGRRVDRSLPVLVVPAGDPDADHARTLSGRPGERGEMGRAGGRCPVSPRALRAFRAGRNCKYPHLRDLSG